MRPHPRKGGSRVEVEEIFPASAGAAARDDAAEFWSDALARLLRLANRIRARQRSPRQAVIVIHGIGEQEPGVTLGRFLKGVLPAGTTEAETWVKPDRASRLFELRRVTLAASPGQERPQTEFYELYWAHLIQDTKLSQVTSWIRRLLLRRRVPARFADLRIKVLEGLLALALLPTAGIAVFWRLQPARAAAILPDLTLGALGLGVAVALAFWRLYGQGIVIGTLGDAARYLRPRPANVERREAIRKAGVDLLETLHAAGNLDRIVLVGHSLGSIIAYDIITHYWIRCHLQHLRLPALQSATSGIGRALAGGVADPQAARELQHDAWRAMRANSQPWLVTDLVTLGSPLSLADFLMADSPTEFETAKKNRILPTCPPVPELVEEEPYVSFDRPYTDRFGGRDRLISFFHHAAPFAVTRWTNLHFANGLLKDPVGGPLGELFGEWIWDRQLADPAGRERLLHSTYWERTTAATGQTEPHLEALQEALDLECGRKLQASMRQHSPLVYLRKQV